MRIKILLMTLFCTFLLTAPWSEGFSLNPKPNFELQVTDYAQRQYRLQKTLFDRHHFTLCQGNMKLEVPIEKIASIKVIDWQVGIAKVEVVLKDGTKGTFKMRESFQIFSKSPFGSLKGCYKALFPLTLQEIQFQ